MTDTVVVYGGFDDARARDLRFLQEAASRGRLTVLLESDDTLQARTGSPPKFGVTERMYFLQAVRYVEQVIPIEVSAGTPCLPPGLQPRLWVSAGGQEDPTIAAWCRAAGVKHEVIPAARLSGYPEPPPMDTPAGPKKVVVTGCYDWFHTGHVRFFEEVSAYGDLYVIVGHDENIRQLKGQGHPLIGEEQRRYVVGSIRHVKQALISSGQGWLDADPEIRRLKPDIYAVNEDGDKGGKREYCHQMGIEYLVLKRTPAPGLPVRSSTALRGF